MALDKIIIATLIGTVVSFVLGFIIHGVLMSDFFASNMGTATGVMKSDEEMLWMPMILGHLAFGLLIALIYGRWAAIKTFSTGAKAGAVIGLLFAATHDLIGLSTTNILTTTGILGNIAASVIITAVVGGAIGWYFGKQ